MAVAYSFKETATRRGRFGDLAAGHVSDLGGRDLLSEAQMSLIRRASAIECELEQMEGQLSKGESVDLDTFTRAASHLRRILEALGLKRVPKDVTASPMPARRPRHGDVRSNASSAPRAYLRRAR
jgi:hypothetical protein